MHSRQGVVHTERDGDNLRKLFPVAEPGLSDSGTFDNVFEFLYMNGRSMAEAAMMMVPEAWQSTSTCRRRSGTSTSTTAA